MDYEKAAAYWTSRDKNTKHMPREALLAAIEKFAGARNTCALATGNGSDIRCTPLEYTYKDGKFWIFSEGGLKFKGLAENSHVSLAIFEPFGGTGTAEGLQVMGKAEMVEPWSPAYTSLMEYKHLPIESLRQMPEPLHLICVTPAAMDYLSFKLRKEGYDARQHLDV